VLSQDAQNAQKQMIENCEKGNEFSCQAALGFRDLTQTQRAYLEKKEQEAVERRDAKQNFELFQLFFIFLVAPSSAIIFFKIRRRTRDDAAFAALPKEGPMQVNITEKDIPPGSFNSKRLKCTLTIDVKMSQADWRSIAQLGLMRKTLFEYPSPAGEVGNPDNFFRFEVESLKDVTHICFNDVMQMQDAKERLITGLHNMRAQIDQHRHGPKMERLEI